MMWFTKPIYIQASPRSEAQLFPYYSSPPTETTQILSVRFKTQVSSVIPYISTNAGRSFHNYMKMHFPHVFISKLGALFVLGLAIALPVAYNKELVAQGNEQSSTSGNLAAACSGMTIVGYRTVRTKVKTCHIKSPHHSHPLHAYTSSICFGSAMSKAGRY